MQDAVFICLQKNQTTESANWCTPSKLSVHFARGLLLSFVFVFSASGIDSKLHDISSVHASHLDSAENTLKSTLAVESTDISWHLPCSSFSASSSSLRISKEGYAYALLMLDKSNSICNKDDVWHTKFIQQLTRRRHHRRLHRARRS